MSTPMADAATNPGPGSSQPMESAAPQALDAPALRALLAQREAQCAEQAAAMEAWMHAVSHDLRAPLRHITSYGPLVRELLEAAPGLDAEARQEALAFLGTMDQSARRMGRMLEGLLALSRVARAPLRVQAVDLAVLVAQAREALERAGTGAGHSVQWQVAGEPPTVQGDAALLLQLLTELLTNALKFTRGRAPACISVDWARGAMGKSRSACRTTAWASIQRRRRGCSASSGACTATASLKAWAPAWPWCRPWPTAMAARPRPARCRERAVRCGCAGRVDDSSRPACLRAAYRPPASAARWFRFPRVRKP